VIARKDMPEVQCRIIGTNKKWTDFWDIEVIGIYRSLFGKRKRGMVAKDDDRWEVVGNAD